ncbi:hypothetical protein EDB80DRAFT_821584 [Ilyonectria destructans]|nr:hypothetical protein EDB80DRAFT_821584 [Ilyonectria destructans]
MVQGAVLYTSLRAGEEPVVPPQAVPPSEQLYGTAPTSDERAVSSIPPVYEGVLNSSPDSTTASDDDTSNRNAGIRHTLKCTFWAACSGLKIPLFYHICSRKFDWSAIDRKTDIAIEEKSQFKFSAFVPNIVHVVAFLTALALILLNASSLYLGGDMPGTIDRDSEKLFGLLFAAKIHELLMLASVGSILGAYIRMELSRDNSTGLPFGALFSPFQFQNLSFLLSSEMAGVYFHDWKKTRRQVLFIGLVVTCCILGVSVGPSSATLMRPRLDTWAAGGTTFWVNITEDELYPKVITDSPGLSHCLVDSGDLSCPAGNWQILDQAFFSYWPQLEMYNPDYGPGSMPGYMIVQSRYSGRDFRIKSNGTMIWAAMNTLASVPLCPLADAVAELGRLWSIAAASASDIKYKYRQEAYFTLEALQPVVMTRCQSNGFPVLDSISDLEPYNKPSSDDSTGIDSIPAIAWLDDKPLMDRLNSSVAAVVTIPGSGDLSPSTQFCSIKAVFAPSSYQAKWSRQKVVAGWPSGIEDADFLDSSFQAIAVNASWARYLNPSISGTNETVLASILRSAGLWSERTPSRGWDREIMESALAALVANGISRAQYNATFGLELLRANWTEEMISPRSRIWAANATKLGHVFNNPEDSDRRTKLEFHATVHGYSYNWAGKAQLLTVVVLFLYMCLVIGHLGVFMATGRSWAGWTSLPEAVAVIAHNTPDTLGQVLGLVGGKNGPLEGYSELVKWQKPSLKGGTQVTASS